MDSREPFLTAREQKRTRAIILAGTKKADKGIANWFCFIVLCFKPFFNEFGNAVTSWKH